MFDQDPTSKLIAQGRQLAATIAAASTQLKAIEAVLRSRALAMPHEPLSNGSREGRRATLRDGDEILSVLFESDVLRASFAAESPTAAAILPLLTEAQTDAILRQKTTFERRVSDGHKFRLLCHESLPQDLAGRVIDALKDRDKNGIVKSKSVLEWNAPNQ